MGLRNSGASNVPVRPVGRVGSRVPAAFGGRLELLKTAECGRLLSKDIGRHLRLFVVARARIAFK